MYWLLSMEDNNYFSSLADLHYTHTHTHTHTHPSYLSILPMELPYNLDKSNNLCLNCYTWVNFFSEINLGINKYLFCWELTITFFPFNFLCESESEVTQSCPTLCDPVNCSLPGSSILGILQARILGCVAISFAMGTSQPRDWTQVSRITGRRFNLWATREAPKGKSKGES